MLWGLMTAQRNPLSRVEIKGGGSSKPRRKKLIITPEQFQEICDRLNEPFRTMVVIAMCLGLRVSEILALKWSDFDFEEGTLMITRWTVHGRIDRVKTEYSEDEMPLQPAFAEIVLSWRAGCPASVEGWVFPNPNTGGVWHASVLQGDILVPTGKEVGIERPGWQTFRHSYRSMLDACGAPIGVQQKLMRHAQVSTTMKYENAYMTEKRKRTEPLCKWFSPWEPMKKRKRGALPLSVGLRGVLTTYFGTQTATKVACIQMVAGGGSEPPTFGL